jgi:hypothetical protein
VTVKKLQSINSFVLFLLLLNILSNGFLIFTHRRNIISSCPEVLTNKILFPSLKISSDLNPTFAFDKTNNLSYLMFGRNGDQNVYMIGHMRCPSTTLHSFCVARSQNISPKYLLRSSNIAFFRYFGNQTT